MSVRLVHTEHQPPYPVFRRRTRWLCRSAGLRLPVGSDMRARPLPIVTVPSMDFDDGPPGEGVDEAVRVAVGIKNVLARIPRGYGQSLLCGPGWYPLIVELDRQIAQVAGSYEVHQVKEKFGTLRYYWELPVIELDCCAELDGDTDMEQHVRSDRHRAAATAMDDWRRSVYLQVEKLVAAAETKSAVTCEACGAAGTLRDSRGWFSTTCESCWRR